MRLIIVSLLFFAGVVHAADEFPNYTIGEGSKYVLNTDSGPTEVTMAVIKRTGDRLVIEVMMKSLSDSSALQIQMWQQFHLRLVSGKMQIEKGIMKIPQIEKPQIFPAEYLQGYSGVKMNSFLIKSEKDISGKKVGTESLTTDAGSFKAAHYQHTENGQNLHFWIADAAKPFGLVKMTSKGSGMGQNYSMTLKGSVSGYKSNVDASKAEPLNEMAKAFLPLLGPSLFAN
jgi:hypothetical protein